LAAIIFVVLGIAAAVLRFFANPGLTDEEYASFGSAIVNTLSITWLALVLVWFERRPDLEFGRALRREMPTILLMIFTTGIPTVLKILRSL
jgi:hypothetical protein